MQLKSVRWLSIAIVLLAILATSWAILDKRGGASYDYRSLRGEVVKIYGRGLYHHMSADVAIQGIAQDYVTLFIAVPLLLLSLFPGRQGQLRTRLLRAGVLSYFFVSYILYLNMAMYNEMFLVYILLTSLSFFALGPDPAATGKP